MASKKNAAAKKAPAKKAAAKKASTKNAPTKKAPTKKAARGKTVEASTRSAGEANPKAGALVHEVLASALDLPEAWRDHPWGDIAMKVRKKAFVFSGQSASGEWGLSVKLPQSGQVVLEMPIASPTGYGLGKSGWVSFELEDSDLPPASMLREFVVESYRAIAPKTLVKALDAAR